MAQHFKIFREVVVDTSAYSIGDVIGGGGQFLSFTSNLFASQPHAKLKEASAIFRNAVCASMSLMLFQEAPEHTAIADNGAFNLAYNDVDKVMSVIRFGEKMNSGSGAKVLKTFDVDENTPVFSKSASGEIYGALLAGDTITFANASGLALSLLFEKL